ncbi:hypothetical protein QFZ33_002211 [Arthrobacter globiformis]|nr:hypothetical protein [Arthrobacter globiformis]
MPAQARAAGSGSTRKLVPWGMAVHGEAGLVLAKGGCTSLGQSREMLTKRGCGQCPHLGLRIRLYRYRTGPDCGCFWGSGGFSEGAAGSSPTSGTCFPCSGAYEPLSVDKLFTCGPLRGPFSIGGRCCGRLAPSFSGRRSWCLLPVHGRDWLGQHDLRKFLVGFLFLVVGCSPGFSLSVRGCCSACSWWVWGSATWLAASCSRIASAGLPTLL